MESLKYLRSTTLDCKDIGIRKSGNDSIPLLKFFIYHGPSAFDQEKIYN